MSGDPTKWATTWFIPMGDAPRYGWRVTRPGEPYRSVGRVGYCVALQEFDFVATGNTPLKPAELMEIAVFAACKTLEGA